MERYDTSTSTERTPWTSYGVIPRPEEVYEDPRCKAKIDKLCEATGAKYTNFITLVFIEGDYADNDILKISDPTYLNKVAAEGGEASVNDIVGVWRDFDSSSSLLTMDDMLKFFANTEQRDGVMRAKRRCGHQE